MKSHFKFLCEIVIVMTSSEGVISSASIIERLVIGVPFWWAEALCQIGPRGYQSNAEMEIAPGDESR